MVIVKFDFHIIYQMDCSQLLQLATLGAFLWGNVKLELYITKGAFPQSVLDQDQWSKITQVIAHQRNWRICDHRRFVDSFDAPWYKWSWITDPDLDHPKGTHRWNLELAKLRVRVKLNPKFNQVQKLKQFKCCSVYQSVMKNLQWCSLYFDHSGFEQVVDNLEIRGIY